MINLETLSLLDKNQVRDIARDFGTPVYVYSQEVLEAQADKALDFPNAFGLTVRYAMKANSNQNILRIFYNKGIEIDASSIYEVERAAKAGIPAENILLTSQELPLNMVFGFNKGLQFNACSLYQLETYGLEHQCKEVGVRINPGLGSGGTNRTNTGGSGSSFGIWHEQFNEIIDTAERYGLKINKIHTHIGSGSDPEIWKKVAGMSLNIVKRFLNAGHDIKILNLGGGYKVGRMSYEKSTDLQECGKPVRDSFIEFAEKTGKELKLEIEPGTFLVANAGAVIAEVIDVKSTPKYNFIITNSGMTEVTRLSLYGAQHPIVVVSKSETDEREKYMVSGHCCESGDILTPAAGDSEALSERWLTKAKIGDFVVIEGSGAYCSSMSVKNYNSYPTASEVLINHDGKASLIRSRGSLENMVEREKCVVKID